MQSWLKVAYNLFCRRLDVILLTAASFGLYANSIPGKFVWDDNQLLQAYSSWTEALTNHFMSHLFFRPIPGLSIYLDAGRFGSSTAGFHITNIALHVAATLLVYLLALKLTSKKPLALLAGLVFAAIPVHVEAVAWISGRTDLFCAVFFLAGLVAHVHYRQSGRPIWLGTAAAAMLLALFSKEAALLFPVAILAYEWTSGYLRKYSMRAWILPYAAALVVYAAARYVSLSILNPVSSEHVQSVFEPASAAERLFALPVNLVRYLKMTFAPHDPVPFYSASTYSSPFRAEVLLSMGVIAVGVAMILYFRSRKPEVSFGLALFGLTMIPACNLIQLPGTTMAERFTYLPSAGLVIAGASLIIAAFEWRTRTLNMPKQALIAVSVVLYLGYSGYLTVIGNLTWRDEFSLWTKAAEKTPDVPFIRNNLGRAYEDRGLADMAQEQYLEAIRLNPDFASAHHNLGLIYRGRGELERAVHHMQLAVKLEPLFYIAMNNLGATYGMRGEYDEAERVLKEALRIMPNYVSSHINLARTYQESGRYADAAKSYKRALELQPELTNARLELGRCYRLAGQFEDARRVLSRLATDTGNFDLRLAIQEELTLIQQTEPTR